MLPAVVPWLIGVVRERSQEGLDVITPREESEVIGEPHECSGLSRDRQGRRFAHSVVDPQLLLRDELR